MEFTKNGTLKKKMQKLKFWIKVIMTKSVSFLLALPLLPVKHFDLR